MHDDSLLQPGLGNPVLDALHVFRAALTAMSEPGIETRLPEATPMASLAPATWALLLSTLDANTPVWISPHLDSPALRANLVFHCGCPIVAERGKADFAVLSFADAFDLREFNAGDPRRPDLSCTLIIQLPTLQGGVPMHWMGAGILGERRVTLPLDETFWIERARRSAFPLGLDIFFTSGSCLLGLPRTTRVINARIETASAYALEGA
ncbi:carbon-phosphorus lyase complex subunit [Betaproteobacteria bacterium]|nr:carbon-phosphorus lyase complex subunit [Betaproteobacteria bacterium]